MYMLFAVLVPPFIFRFSRRLWRGEGLPSPYSPVYPLAVCLLYIGKNMLPFVSRNMILFIEDELPKRCPSNYIGGELPDLTRQKKQKCEKPLGKNQFVLFCSTPRPSRGKASIYFIGTPQLTYQRLKAISLSTITACDS